MITLTDNDADFILRYLQGEFEKDNLIKKVRDDNFPFGVMIRKCFSTKAIADVEQEAEKEANYIRKCIELLTIGSKEE